MKLYRSEWKVACLYFSKALILCFRRCILSYALIENGDLTIVREYNGNLNCDVVVEVCDVITLIALTTHDYFRFASVRCL